MSRLATLSPKVLAAGAGAGGGAVVGSVVLWAIGAGIFGGGWDAYSAADAVAAVPAPLSGFVLLTVAVVGAVWAGYAKVDPDRNGPLPVEAPGRSVFDQSPLLSTTVLQTPVPEMLQPDAAEPVRDPEDQD